MLRKELITELSQHCEALKSIDLDEFIGHMEDDAEAFESDFIRLYSDENSRAPQVPVFDFKPTV